MAPDAEVKAWVSDRLHDLLGYSESSVAGFIVAVAKKAAGPDELAASLRQQGLPATPGTAQFAQELIARLPRRAAAEPAQRARDRAAEQFARSNARYALLEDDGDDGEAQATAAAAAKERSRGGKKNLRQRAKGGDYEDDDTKVRERKRPRRSWEEEEEEGGQEEKAREKDREEKEAFEARLEARDKAQTRNVAEPKMSKAERREAEMRERADGEGRQEAVPKLREYSRQAYLGKREAQKLEALRDEIEDEKYMFEGMELSRREREEIRKKEELLRIAEEHRRGLEALKEDGYRMPDGYDEETAQGRENRFKALYGRYQEVPEEEDEATPWKVQERWEDAQARKSRLKPGGGKARGDEYELITEDQIEFIKHEYLTGERDVDEESEDEREREQRERMERAKTKKEKIRAERAALPIYPYRDELLDAIEKHQVLIIVAETGAGKTTQIPQYLMEAGYSNMGKIGCTQPRRVAAMSVAARVAQEMDVKLGGEVGYSIRFEDCTSDKTVIKYMTDGMLLREFLGEPDLATYSVMIIDEAHERTLSTDVLFGLVKDITRFREDLKLLISSATLDAEKFSDYFDNAPIFKVPGRRYPVDIMYTKAPEADYVDAAVVTVLQIHVTQPTGDILVFLTGQEEIENAEEALKERTRGKGSKIGELMVCPIYANLPTDLQAKIFEPTPEGARKVVLATNIAETSVTIDGIRYVIDTGLVKQNSYNPRSGMEQLLVTPVSKAAAQQRAGRAGRTAPGKCYRLYTAWSYEHELEDNTIPEIQRTNLGNVVLMLKSLGINDLVGFDFMDPPPSETLIRALEQLYALGALNDRGELTKLGRRMAELPLDPMLSKTLIASEAGGVSEEIATVCAMLSVGSAVFYRPKDKAIHADSAHAAFHRGDVGDHVALMNVYNAWAETDFSQHFCYENFVQERAMKRARDIRDQLVGLMERVEVEMVSDVDNHDAIRKAVTAGFFYHAAQLQKDGSYKTVKNRQTVHLHPSSGLREVLPRWVVYHELVLTSKEYVRGVSEIKPEWLVEIAPHYYDKKDVRDEAGKKMPKGKGRASMTA
ncbi:unnamed protein product [Ostreobium quekettii]|uniref:RNA helicase n=1 Tax=Ostreobium quekettii TaxID=121088 RepID=A0A8S1J6T5_9CHLO|nr:unnamed protein product [Ostreobium quekettii]|eukprot:evm.model.scf_1425.1 EVM.evm.TU.scf_1425.1   scf_1425:8596-12074(+)